MSPAREKTIGAEVVAGLAIKPSGIDALRTDGPDEFSGFREWLKNRNVNSEQSLT